MALQFHQAYGCLAGLALGDALGMPTEFMSPEEIHETFGRVDGLVKAYPAHPHSIFEPGMITDDTAHALAIAHAYNGDGLLTARAVADELLAWADSLDQNHLAVIIGPSTRQALDLLRQGNDPRRPGIYGKTNGAAMRIAPVGLVNAGDPKGLMQDVLEACLPTHGSRPGISGAAAVAFAIAEALQPGSSPPLILEAARRGARQGSALGEWGWSTSLEKRIELAEMLIAGAENETAALCALYDFVGVDVLTAESVATALGIVRLAAGDPMRAVFMAANLGGDTDTIAAIAGAICGAWMGIEAIDQALLTRVQNVSQIDLAAEARRLVEIAEIKLQRRTKS